MTIVEGRLAVAADAPVMFQAQHDTAAAINIDPWTADQARGLAENAAMPRPNYYFIVAPTAADGSVEGFMQVWRPRNPDLNDPTHVSVQLVCSRILSDGDDRNRLRRVLISTFKALTRMCNQHGLTWEAWFPQGIAQFAVGGFATDMQAGSHITVTPQQRPNRNGVLRDGFLVTSAATVTLIDAVQWPSA